MTTVIVAAAIGTVTSFLGSMGAFVLWVHFDLDERWRARKEHNKLKDIQYGLDIENEQRMLRGLPPLQPSGSLHLPEGYDYTSDPHKVLKRDFDKFWS